MSREELKTILIRIEHDDAFLQELNETPGTALEDYELTWQEIVALRSGDVAWIEAQVGKLDERLKTRLEWPSGAGGLSPKVEGFLREIESRFRQC